MAAPAFASSQQSRRSAPLSLNLSALPPYKMASPVGEKDALPCIMITPSTPVHDEDFEIHYFHPMKRQQGFLGHIRDAFSLTPTHRITLSSAPDAFSYGQTSPTRWPAVRKFRTFLLMLATLFIGVHLFVLPVEDDGLYRVLQGHQGGSTGPFTSAIVWSDVEPVSNSAESAIASTADPVVIPVVTDSSDTAAPDTIL